MIQSQDQWPVWWSWELDVSNPHLAKRMLDRSFSETDLRAMLEVARAFRPDQLPGRWCIETTHDDEPWEVIVEPDDVAKLLVIITAFPVS